MPGYNQYTLASFKAQIAGILDDRSELYWTPAEKSYAVWEGLRVWGALTNYWRARGTFNLTPNQPYYDLSAQLPALRPRAWTLGQLVTEIQYYLLEAANGITGSGMTGQTSIAAILAAVQRARNRFALDSHMPYSAGATSLPVSDTPDGLIQLPQTCMYLHRAAWRDLTTGRYQNLWRQDAWAIDHGNPDWIQQPGFPVTYSESELSPLQIQLSPAPVASGSLELITVDSLMMDLTSAATTFNVPDEWIHAVKYAALADLLGADSQLNDPLRASYCDMRYTQAVTATDNASSLMRVLLNGQVLPLDSFAAIDAGIPAWRNQTGMPLVAGAQYDFLTFARVPGSAYSITADVVRAAPLPVNESDLIQMGPEDIPSLMSYCLHVLLFKCGGDEFKNTFGMHDSFMKSVAGRGGITEAEITYLGPLFGQPSKDQAERPDRVEKASA